MKPFLKSSLVVAAATLACSAFATAADSNSEPVIHINDFAYAPTPLRIHVGDRVRFINDDDEAHTVTAKDNSFDSEGLDTGKSWGEHDVIGSPDAYFAAFKNRQAPKGWSSWDQGGIHFLALVNVFNFEVSGKLGSEQLYFAEKDLAAQSSSTPIVVFGHVPLYALYPTWGWTTEDGARLIAAVRSFDAATVLNGHIRQIVEHTDGNIRFATAAATAYPQPPPGTAPKPGPLLVPHERLLT